jgi:2-iminobutanoate/2-iminopropanoate deaminase
MFLCVTGKCSLTDCSAQGFQIDGLVQSLFASRSPTMTREIILSPDAPPPAAYSQAVKAAGLIFVSGTGPFDPVSGIVVQETIQEQTTKCLNNISAILAAAGSSLSKVVSATVILPEEENFSGMNEEWVGWFPVDPPARQGARLPARFPGMRISVAVTAEA